MLAALVAGGALALLPITAWAPVATAPPPAAAAAPAQSDAPNAPPAAAAPAPPAQPPPTLIPAPGGEGGGEAPPIAAEPVLPAPPPASPAPAPPAATPAAAAAPADDLLKSDELPNAGYVPGYRTYKGQGLSPYAPRTGALPGGMTPGYGAPMPPGAWTFRFNGFLSATLQTSFIPRDSAPVGQSRTVFHIPPYTVDEYASFLGTSTMPGQWVALNFSYGNGKVSANVSLNTWNPSAPATYYAIGSQYFINHAYLNYDLPAFGPLRLRVLAGYFHAYYGNLSQYGLGMYTSSVIGSPRGVGEVAIAEYVVDPNLSFTLEHGIMGNRNGRVPDGVVPNGGNGGATDPVFMSSWIHHLHLGVVRKGSATVKAQLHYLTNWGQDDRSQMAADNPTTRLVDESHIQDGRINVFGADATVQHGTWGYFGAAGSYITGKQAVALRGLFTFGGEGTDLANRWWGGATHGSGNMMVGALNWGFSLGRILDAPNPHPGDAPDLAINMGLVLAYTTTDTKSVSGTTDPTAPLPDDADLYNHRLRYKFAAEGVYTFSPFMGAALRGDRVAPNSKDDAETFYVLAPRVFFKTNWFAHETITLLYAKWFYGSATHSEAGSTLATFRNTELRLDDQLIALNVNMWW